MRDGHWQRMKACRNPQCRWVFYDHSRNRTGTWCSMRVCGNRHKVRDNYFYDNWRRGTMLGCDSIPAHGLLVRSRLHTNGGGLNTDMISATIASRDG